MPESAAPIRPELVLRKRLRRWLARWALQVVGVGVAMPLTTLTIYILSTKAGAPPFWLDRDRMDGWMLTFLSIRDLALLATFFSLVAIAVEAAHSLKLLDWVPQSVLARTALRDGEPIHEVT